MNQLTPEKRALQEVEKRGGSIGETELVFAVTGESRAQTIGEVQGLVFARRLNRTRSERGYWLHLTDKGRKALEASDAE